MRIQIVMKLVGQLVMIFSGLMLLPFLYGCLVESAYYSLLGCSLGGFSLGYALYRYGLESSNFTLRDGFLVVSSMWLITSVLGALPFFISGILPNFADALFESVSGITATGASVIPNVDELPISFVLWRSLLHWMGGMGIIVLVLAFLKNLGADSAHFFNAEASVPRPGMVLPRIRSTASTLWKIYVIFTIICIGALWLAGMSFYDAVNISFSTISTGGFTPHQDGTFLYAENDAIRFVLIVFMILAGGNFTVYARTLKGGLREIWQDYEYRMYLASLGIGIFFVFLGLEFQTGEGFGASVSDAMFMLISMQTGSGFAMADYDKWPPMAQMTLFISTFLGGCSGSTTGGIKIIRIILLLKSSIVYLRKSIHPDLVQVVRVGVRPIPTKWLQMAQQFFFLYMSIFAISSLLISMTGVEVGEAMQCVAGILGNVGLAFGQFGPTDSFAPLATLAKLVCVADMLLGRLELFTLLVLLHPGFWKGYFVKMRPQRRIRIN